jgi:hypothetical protein
VPKECLPHLDVVGTVRGITHLIDDLGDDGITLTEMRHLAQQAAGPADPPASGRGARLPVGYPADRVLVDAGHKGQQSLGQMELFEELY